MLTKEKLLSFGDTIEKECKVKKKEKGEEKTKATLYPNHVSHLCLLSILVTTVEPVSSFIAEKDADKRTNLHALVHSKDTELKQL